MLHQGDPPPQKIFKNYIGAYLKVIVFAILAHKNAQINLGIYSNQNVLNKKLKKRYGNSISLYRPRFISAVEVKNKGNCFLIEN